MAGWTLVDPQGNEHIVNDRNEVIRLVRQEHWRSATPDQSLSMRVPNANPTMGDEAVPIRIDDIPQAYSMAPGMVAPVTPQQGERLATNTANAREHMIYGGMEGTALLSGIAEGSGFAMSIAGMIDPAFGETVQRINQASPYASASGLIASSLIPALIPGGQEMAAENIGRAASAFRSARFVGNTGRMLQEATEALILRRIAPELGLSELGASRLARGAGELTGATVDSLVAQQHFQTLLDAPTSGNQLVADIGLSGFIGYGLRSLGRGTRAAQNVEHAIVSEPRTALREAFTVEDLGGATRRVIDATQNGTVAETPFVARMVNRAVSTVFGRDEARLNSLTNVRAIRTLARSDADIGRVATRLGGHLDSLLSDSRTILSGVGSGTPDLRDATRTLVLQEARDTARSEITSAIAKARDGNLPEVASHLEGVLPRINSARASHAVPGLLREAGSGVTGRDLLSTEIRTQLRNAEVNGFGEDVARVIGTHDDALLGVVNGETMLRQALKVADGPITEKAIRSALSRGQGNEVLAAMEQVESSLAKVHVVAPSAQIQRALGQFQSMAQDLVDIRETLDLRKALRQAIQEENSLGQEARAFGLGTLASMMGLGGGGIVGGALVSALTRPASTVKRMAEATRAVSRLRSTIARGGVRVEEYVRKNKNSRGLITPQRAIPSIAEGITASNERYEEIRQELIGLASDPEQLINTLTLSSFGLDLLSSDLAVASQTTAASGLFYLVNHLPMGVPDPMRPGKELLPPSKTELQGFANRVDALDNPAGLLDKFVDGTLTPEHVDAVRTVFPPVYNEQAITMLETIAALHAEETPIPYQVNTRLSIMFGVEPDPTFSSQFVMQMQSDFAQTPEQAETIGLTGPKRGPGVRNMSNFSLTQSQELEGLER